MKSIILLVLLAFAAVAVVAQNNQCTSFPSLFSSRAAITILDDDECVNHFYNAYYFYSYTDMFTRIDISTSSGGVSIYSDYTAGLQYIFDRGTDSCFSMTLSSSLSDPTLPSTASYQGSVQLGQETLQTFSIPASDGTGEVDLSLAQDGCSLVSVTTYNYTTGAVNLVESFYDFFPDVPDNTFNLPLECQDSNLNNQPATAVAAALEAHSSETTYRYGKFQLFNRPN